MEHPSDNQPAKRRTALDRLFIDSCSVDSLIVLDPNPHRTISPVVIQVFVDTYTGLIVRCACNTPRHDA